MRSVGDGVEIYKLTASGSELTLVLVSDACTLRARILGDRFTKG
jgi:hypothetical protein